MSANQTVTLNREPSEAAHTRRHVADACQGLLPHVTMNAQLMASELFTNALEYGTGPITLDVAVRSDSLRVDISDHSDTQPTARCAATEDIHGRGLLIIEQLAHSWGVDLWPDGRGKSVWFTLSTR
jgi:anti-sigma regulatory factor (Ser/Thr protein kinase)